MVACISPAQPPFAPEIQERVDRMVLQKGIPPLALFTATFARDKRLFEMLHAGRLA